MIISVVACGDSAKHWNKTPCDMSIGVNDCFKFGYDVDYLLCVNAPHLFQPNAKNGYTNRLYTILQSKPKRFITSLCPEWRKYRYDVDCIHIQRFGKYFRKGINYFSKTSPFIAINYAYNLGAKDIILWGIDFLNHPVYKPGKRGTDFEIEEYMRLIGLIQNDGVKVWLGNSSTMLNKYLELYT